MKGHYPRPPKGLSELERFMRHVEKQENGCWNWTGSLKNPENPWGSYGQFKFRGKMERAHRVSYILHKGEVPEGLCVLHKRICVGNPLCVNPEHLYAGTKKENAEDREEQGRGADHRGSANGRATVTEEIVIEMRKVRPAHSLLKKPYYRTIAAQFGTSIYVAKNIINRQTWKHLP